MASTCTQDDSEDEFTNESVRRDKNPQDKESSKGKNAAKEYLILFLCNSFKIHKFHQMAELFF